MNISRVAPLRTLAAFFSSSSPTDGCVPSFAEYAYTLRSARRAECALFASCFCKYRLQRLHKRLAAYVIHVRGGAKLAERVSAL